MFKTMEFNQWCEVIFILWIYTNTFRFWNNLTTCTNSNITRSFQWNFKCNVKYHFAIYFNWTLKNTAAWMLLHNNKLYTKTRVISYWKLRLTTSYFYISKFCTNDKAHYIVICLSKIIILELIYDLN